MVDFAVNQSKAYRTPTFAATEVLAEPAGVLSAPAGSFLVETCDQGRRGLKLLVPLPGLGVTGHPRYSVFSAPDAVAAARRRPDLLAWSPHEPAPKPPSRLVADRPTELPCSKCGETLPVARFSRNRAVASPRYASNCKACDSAYYADWRARKTAATGDQTAAAAAAE